MTKLGLGLIGIGRKWGVIETPIPDEKQALIFLDQAYKLGIRFFDTAPAYGLSEERLGKWFRTLSSDQQLEVTIETKCGEFWDFNTGRSYRKFEFESLKQSVDRSIELIGKVDTLLIHGFTKAVFDKYHGDLNQVFAYAKEKGVLKVGVSLSDPDFLANTLDLPLDVIQVPHNILYPHKSELIKKAENKGIIMVINRPFGMGEIGLKSDQEKIKAFKFILQDVQKGIILTGTKSMQHLEENIHLFQEAQKV